MIGIPMTRVPGLTRQDDRTSKNESDIVILQTRDRGSLAKDDRLDVLAMAVGYWAESMARDTDRAHDDHLEDLRDKALAEFE